MIEARIKLAEAMGWKPHQISKTCIAWFGPGKGQKFVTRDDLPNPFKNANHDFAVRDFMNDVYYGQVEGIDQGEYHYNEYISALDEKPIDKYQVGDIAKAACVGLQIPLSSQSDEPKES